MALSKYRALLMGAGLVGALALGTSAAWAVKDGPVEDPIRVVKVPKGAPIVVGFYTVLSGPDVGQGLDPYRGAQIAAEDAGNKLLGHPVKFQAEDDGCNAEGGQTAATKLAANKQVVVALGSNCSPASLPAAPILWKAGIPDIATGAASPKLTDVKTRGPGYEGFTRVIYNALFEGEALAVGARLVDVADLLQQANQLGGDLFAALQAELLEHVDGLVEVCLHLAAGGRLGFDLF